MSEVEWEHKQIDEYQERWAANIEGYRVLIYSQWLGAVTYRIFEDKIKIFENTAATASMAKTDATLKVEQLKYGKFLVW